MKKIILILLIAVAISCEEEQKPTPPNLITWEVINPNPNYLTPEQRNPSNGNDPCPYFKTWWTKFKTMNPGQFNPYMVNTWGYGQAVGATIAHGYRPGLNESVHRNTSTFECRNLGTQPLDMYFNGSSTPIRLAAAQSVNMVIVSPQCISNTSYSFPVIIRKVSVSGGISIQVTHIDSLEPHGIAGDHGVGWGI